MLSISPVKSVDHAKEYFMGGQNYYMGDGNGKSVWWGKGSASLGLSGIVKADIFEDLLQGHLPNGEVIGKTVDGEVKHRPGFDLTFSVPKSASIMALRSDDKSVYDSIIQSTFKSVEKALGMIEHACASARITQEGNTYYMNTGNLVVALHLHELSREDEANIHIHAVVMNMTKRSDGKWRSLASKSGYYGKNATTEIQGFFERVGNQKKQLGMIFRAELAYDLKQKGFPIVITDRKQGFFEIEGISEASMSAHSTRSQQKNEYMNENGLSGGNAAAIATKITRNKKSKKSHDAIVHEWNVKEHVKGADARSEVREVVRQMQEANNSLSQPKTNQPSLIQATAAVAHAIEILSDTQVKIKSIQLINSAIKNSIGQDVNVALISKAIEKAILDGSLVPIEEKNGELYYTTKTIFQAEKDIIQAIATKTCENMKMSQAKIDSFLEKQKTLTNEQKEAIQTIFLSEHRITALEGKSHTGKTTLLKPMAELAKRNGYEPIILTPSKAGSLAIKENIQKAPSTIQHFFNKLFDLNQYGSVSGFIHQQLKNNEIGTTVSNQKMIFIDNAQLLSLKQVHELTIIAEKTNARLVPLFDKRAPLSWQAGNPLQQMLENGMKTAVLEKVVDGKQSKMIHDAVKDTLEENIIGAFNKIEHRIFSIEDKEQRNRTIATMYANLTPDERKQTQVIMLSQAQCSDANLAIHEELKRTQQISKISVFIPVIIPKSMKAAEYKLAENYRASQWIRFNESYESLNVNKGDYLKIISVDKKNNLITLKDDKDKIVQWNPMKVAGSATKVEIYDEKLREISQGETLTWKRNNFRYALSSGESLTVLSASSTKLLLERENRKKISIDLGKNQNRHFDYGYALTPNAAIHKKVDSVIAYQHAYSRQSHQRLFYKVLSQAKNNAWIFTENKNMLLNHIQNNSGDKITAIDTLIQQDKFLLSTASSQEEHLLLLEKAVSLSITRLRPSSILPNKTPESISKEAVQYALAHLAEREASFQHRDVLTVALKYIFGEVNSDHIQAAVIHAEKDGMLVRGMYSSNGTLWTTKDAIDLEREIITLAKTDQGKMSALIEGSKVENYISVTPMKRDHVNAVREWMATPDRVVVLQGDAGTGKTTLLERAQPLLKAESFLKGEGYTLLCLAPTHVVVDELASRGLIAQTLDSFLSEQQTLRLQGKATKFDNKLIIAVDENSMISNRRERDFLFLIHEIEARAAVIGDKRQYSSIEAGKPHAVLQSDAVGIKVIHLDDIVRQKNQVLLKGVIQTYQKNFSAAFETIKDHIIEVGQAESGQNKGLDTPEVRLEKIAIDYLSLSEEKRAVTGILTLGNKQRIYLNEIIREGLKAQGELYGNPVKASILVSKDMTKVEHTKVANFAIGDIIRFGVSDSALSVKKGDYLAIEQVHKQENLITLRKNDGERVVWQPKQWNKDTYRGIEVYHREKRELMPGDLIRWTRSDKANGLISPNMARVETINKDVVSLCPVKLTDTALVRSGKSFEINLSEPTYQHWDYAHVMTSYGAQGKGFINVLSNMESYSQHLTNQAAFLINLSRSILHFSLYTDNKKALLEKIYRTVGSKTSALETIGEIRLHNDSHSKTKPQDTEIVTKNSGSITNAPRVEKQKETSYLDANRIINDLHAKAEFVVKTILGEPKSRSGNNYQYSYSEQFGGEDGKREGGSLSVVVNGEKQGLWNCFKTGEKGNLIGLIQKKLNFDFKQSLEYSAQILGLNKDQVTVHSRVQSMYQAAISVDKSNPKNWSKKEKEMVAFAQKLARESLPVKGTLAEKYLKEHRAIELKNIPDSIRFHPGISAGKDKAIYPALLAIGRNDKGQVQRVQAIYLDNKTASKADLDIKKRSYALAPGSSVNLSRNIKNKQVSYLAEGVETGLSILKSVDNGNVEVVLGKSNFKHPAIKNLAQNVVLCLDNDGRDPIKEKEINKQINDAAMALLKQGKTVWIAKPDEAGKDYNDVLKKQGSRAVKNNIEQAILYQDYANQSSHPSIILKEELSSLKINPARFMDKKLQKSFSQHEINKDQIASVNRLAPNTTHDKLTNEFSRANAVRQNNNRKYDELCRSIYSQSQIKQPEIIKPKIHDFEREI